MRLYFIHIQRLVRKQVGRTDAVAEEQGEKMLLACDTLQSAARMF